MNSAEVVTGRCLKSSLIYIDGKDSIDGKDGHKDRKA